ncbi:MAG: PAS domain-containing protein, partial [Candidatus Competibacteraceae bacterium]|nr:PAS domain-containing protein [Candidatus Competibacteraceae bacterium]
MNDQSLDFPGSSLALTVLEGLPQAVVAIAANGRVVMANQEASRLLGATPLPNRSFRGLLAGRPAGTLRRMHRRLLAGHGQVTGRLTLRRNAGPPLTLEVTVNRVTRQGEEL